MTGERDIRSELPSVDRVLQESQDLVSRWGHQRVSEEIREYLCEIRERVTAGQSPDWSILAIRSAVNTQLSVSDGHGIRPVINLSGIVLHTNLGRDSDLRRLATELRMLPRPVIGRIHDGRLLLDLRCLDCESLFLQQLPQLSDALSC